MCVKIYRGRKKEREREREGEREREREREKIDLIRNHFGFWAEQRVGRKEAVVVVGGSKGWGQGGGGYRKGRETGKGQEREREGVG